MTFGINMGVWAFDRYIRKADFAYIDFHTIKDNIKHGFVWDNDAMGTNMFMYPYHGSLYFNSARSNGYNYWQSGLYAFGGSFMWEMFMENEYPSTNDIIATPIGGMALGEVFYRAFDLILDDRKTGASRFGLEFASFVVSPMRGLTPQDMDWEHYNSKTLNAQGDRSMAILHATGLRLDIKLRKGLYLTGDYMNYTHHTRYKHYENIFPVHQKRD